MKKIIILKLGSTFATLAAQKGDFEHWVIEKSGYPSDNFFVHNAMNGENFPNIRDFSGVILTGSHDMVTDNHAWIESTANWLKKSVVGIIPVFGICFGHQLLAQALGGAVDYNADGMEIGTFQLQQVESVSSNELFEGINFPLHVIMSHSQSIEKLPQGAINLAKTERCEIAAFYVPPFTWGVQFHPEFDESIVKFYIERASKQLKREGQNPEELWKNATDTPESTKILRHFCGFCFNNYWNL